ncbi:MAG: sigma-54-dependent Fis family transcriptional regulator [Planctomycetes bacterium]|nr:sigma-54-dependent Fis family transcriptional regulator [Planctomycetota bacterium]
METEAAILIVDDEEGTRASLARALDQPGYRVRGVESAEAALAALEKESFDVILCDIRLGGMDGLELQKRIRADHPDVPVVMITAYAAVETAVRALKQGAYDYLAKPFSAEEARSAVHRALESRRLRLENDSLREVLRGFAGEVWVGNSAPIRRLYEEAAKVARSNATVFISGESGTGKEILARYLHARSLRERGIFVALNCAALPENLADSQMFGHVRGAFTGAVADQRGHLELAHGGTLFLDEIADLKLDVQAKLLRVLEEHHFRRLGSEREISVDVRVLAAAQRSPEQLVKEGKLREDLYYRLGAIHLEVPPLRERPGDIADLALHFLARFSQELKKPVEGLEPEALSLLEKYPWPGNVRELKNVMERAALFVQAGSRVGIADFPEKIRRTPGTALFVVEAPQPLPLRELSRRYIRHVLDLCDGNQAKAARLLEISPSTLWRHFSKTEAAALKDAKEATPGSRDKVRTPHRPVGP